MNGHLGPMSFASINHTWIIYQKKKKPNKAPLQITLPYGQQKIAQGPAFTSFSLIRKQFLTMLNIFLRIAKSCFPLQRSFPCFEISLWNVGALGSCECPHKGKAGFPVWWWVCRLCNSPVWVHSYDLCGAAIETWTGFLVFLCLSFHICKMFWYPSESFHVNKSQTQ